MVNTRHQSYDPDIDGLARNSRNELGGDEPRRNYGGTALAVGAGGAGAYVGTKIGQYISDKMGLA
jgi:hypothetical protein